MNVRIKTESVNGRTDWYHAHAVVGGRHYFSFQKERMSALADVLRQLAVKGVLAF